MLLNYLQFRRFRIDSLLNIQNESSIYDFQCVIFFLLKFSITLFKLHFYHKKFIFIIKSVKFLYTSVKCQSFQKRWFSLLFLPFLFLIHKVERKYQELMTQTFKNSKMTDRIGLCKSQIHLVLNAKLNKKNS